MIKLAPVVAVLLAALSPLLSLAGTHDQPVLALHIPVGVCKCPDVCTSGLNPLNSLTPCSEYTENHEPLAGREVFLVVARGDSAAGVAHVSCGVWYSNMFATWSLCADLQVTTGAWPNPGGGNVISWNSGNCQRSTIGDEGVHAVAGFFYMYAYGDALFEMTPNTAGGEPVIVVWDCSDSQYVAPGASVGFGSVSGSNPCKDPVPVRATTWGGMKRAYRR